MLFLNPRRVAEKLRNDALSETTRYRFVVGALLLQGGDALTRSLYTSGTTGQRLAGALLAVVVSLVGLHFAHRTNERGDNRAFIERWLCLSVPLTFWTRNVPYIVQVGLYYVMGTSPLFGQFLPLIWVGHWLLLVLFYVALNRYMHMASGERRVVETLGPPLASP